MMYAYSILCILNTIQKNVSKPRTSSRNALGGPSAKTGRTFTPAQLLVFFLQLLPSGTLLKLPALKGKTFYHRLFTPLVTLWYLLFQRLNHDHSLDAALADAQHGGANKLNGKLARRSLSSCTASYSDARHRLPWEFLLQALQLLGRRITAQSPATTLWKGLQVCLLDGTTVRLRSYPSVAKELPAHPNQHRQQPYWCLLRVVVDFCCFTGAALDCALGPVHLSEQALGCELILRRVGACLFIGDRNFGVFRIVQAARAARQHLLVRLTEPRAAKRLGRALSPGDYALSWKPTCRDQLPAGMSREPVLGRLIVAQVQRRGFRSQQLCLFTTLTDPAQYPAPELLRLYGLRWHIELNLRYVKTQMEAMQLEAHSPAMARKEWLATLLAYNLIRAAMLAAALQQNISPLTLSFSACRRRLEHWLRDFGGSQGNVLRRWKKTLLAMSQCRLPRRPRPRPSEPRAQRHLRQPFPPLTGSRAVARKKLQKLNAKS